MRNQHSLSVILPAYNEEGNIAQAVADFFETGVVDEVIVVENNSTDRTVDRVRSTQAKLISETRQGYGYAIWRGLREARGDLVAISEPDGTFTAKDIFKLLAYVEEFDMVLGTRTSRALIWHGANMGFAMKFGNLFVAKLLEWLFNGPALSDVGCTMRLIKKEALDKILPHFRVGGSAFSPEMTLLAILKKIRIIEIPLNYRPRIGVSKITGKKWNAAKLGMRMIGLILKYRLYTWLHPSWRARLRH